MPASPIEVVGRWLENLVDPDVVNAVVAEDAAYVSTYPFSIFAKVVDGKVTFVQFLEDTYATAASFREGGSWTVRTQADEESFEV